MQPIFFLKMLFTHPAGYVVHMLGCCLTAGEGHETTINAGGAGWDKQSS